MATRKPKTRRVKGTYTDEMQKLFRKFLEATKKKRKGRVPTLDDAFDWVEEHTEWAPPRKSIRAQFKAEMAKALRAELVVDPQGRLVRQNYAVKLPSGDGPQTVFWADINAPPEHVHMSLQQRRAGLVSIGYRLYVDTRSYNENNAHNAQLELDFNITTDILDRLHPAEYPEERPPEDQ